MRIKYADLAREDLEDIFAFTAERWNRSQARTYLRAIQAHVAQLAVGQGHSRPIPERPNILQSRIQSHYVIFTRDEISLKVRRVLHVRMDTLAHI